MPTEIPEVERREVSEDPAEREVDFERRLTAEFVNRQNNRSAPEAAEARAIQARTATLQTTLAAVQDRIDFTKRLSAPVVSSQITFATPPPGAPAVPAYGGRDLAAASGLVSEVLSQVSGDMAQRSAKRFLVEVLGFPPSAIGEPAQVFNALSAARGTAPAQMSPDETVLRAFSARWDGVADAAFWRNVSDVAKAGGVTAGDLVQFMNHTKLLFPMEQPLSWLSATEKLGMVRDLVKAYAKDCVEAAERAEAGGASPSDAARAGGRAGVDALLDRLAQLKRKGTTLPRFVQADLAQLALAQIVGGQVSREPFSQAQELAKNRRNITDPRIAEGACWSYSLTWIDQLMLAPGETGSRQAETERVQFLRNFQGVEARMARYLKTLDRTKLVDPSTRMARRQGLIDAAPIGSTQYLRAYDHPACQEFGADEYADAMDAFAARLRENTPRYFMMNLLFERPGVRLGLPAIIQEGHTVAAYTEGGPGGRTVLFDANSGETMYCGARLEHADTWFGAMLDALKPLGTLKRLSWVAMTREANTPLTH